MKPGNVRLWKEARALFLPWCVVTAAGALQWLLAPVALYFMPRITLVGFFFGIPLLAVLSLGNEFQYRTVPLLLSQPISRARIWAEKWIVLIAAILSAAFVYWLEARLISGFESVFFVAVYAAAISSAMFWTLTAKSTIGGAVLNLLQAVVIFFLVQLTNWLLGPNPSSAAVKAALRAGSFGCAVLAVLMLWLGYRKLRQFEATGEFTGNDLLAATPRITGVTAAWFRYRTRSPWLNLIRKEIHLVWPAWLVTGFVLVFLICMTPFRSVSSGDISGVVPAIAFSVLMMVVLLSGSLSMGEERTLGTHAWHVTLPISMRRQWLTKVMVAVLTALVCAAIVMGFGRLLFGPFFTPEDPAFNLLIGSVLVSLAAFWCASAAKGTVRAALCVFPAIGVILLAFGFGRSLGMILIRNSITDYLISKFHPFPFSNSMESFLNRSVSEPFGPVSIGIVVLMAVIQSYRLFRTEVRESVFSIVRYLLPLAVVMFICGVPQPIPVVVTTTADRQTRAVLQEVSTTIDNLRLDVTKLDTAHPLQLNFQDLAKAAAPSELTRRWLNGRTITVTPKTISRRIWDGRSHRWITGSFGYFSTVELRNNWSCSVYGTDRIFFSCTSPSGRWGFPAFP